ncbi:MAG: ORF6N domain-containing protein [Elusimicrobia bacterium]|nr:ORF6N domain-containing protein [Elusimicrobiota bacterium]
MITERIEELIFVIRGKKVMMDRDLAELYQVPTYRLNEQVKRNLKRFPEDFMFPVTRRELKELIANCDRFAQLKHSSSLPYSFTEQGVAMLSSVLNSERAVAVNIHIMRVFTRMRELMLQHRDLEKRINELEKKYDRKFRNIFEAIRKLLEPPHPPPKNKGPMGFFVPSKESEIKTGSRIKKRASERKEAPLSLDPRTDRPRSKQRIDKRRDG